MKFIYEYRVRRVRRSCAADAKNVSSPHVAGELFRTFTRGESRELFMVACLDARNACMGIEIVGVGGMAGVDVHPREVFRAAIIAHAIAIVVAHNHPSGVLTPSDQDMALTRRLLDAGELLGIPLLDHIIVSDEGFYSFGEHHYL